MCDGSAGGEPNLPKPPCCSTAFIYGGECQEGDTKSPPEVFRGGLDPSTRSGTGWEQPQAAAGTGAGHERDSLCSPRFCLPGMLFCSHCFLGREPSSSGLHSARLRAAGGIELQLNSSRALKSRQMEFSNPAISRSNKTSANPKPQVFTRQAGTAGVPQMVLGAVIPVLQLEEPGQGAGRELSPASRAGEGLLSALSLPGEAQQLSTLLGAEILISCPKSVPRTQWSVQKCCHGYNSCRIMWKVTPQSSPCFIEEFGFSIVLFILG